MGKRGPAPKPTALRVLHGDRKDRIKDDPTPATGEVVCPEWLPTKPREVWATLAPDLVDKGVLSPWDVDLFASFCALVIENREALVDLDEKGNQISVVSRELRDGTLIYSRTKNPSWQVAKESAALMVTIGGRFGLTPSDRAQLSVKKDGDGQGAERLMS